MVPWPTCVPVWADLLPGLRVAAVGPGVWLAVWDPEPAAQAQRAWSTLLDASLRARAERIGTPRGRVRFTASHAAMTALTSGDPAGVVTSLAHTRWCAAVGVSRDRIGVDLEADAPRPLWPVAARTAWGVPGPPTWPDFLEAWVRREAALKAGGGSDAATARVSRVTLGDVAPEHLLAVVGGPGTGGDQRPGRRHTSTM